MTIDLQNRPTYLYELLVTTTFVFVVVSALVLIVRAIFPDPELRGTHCPGSLGVAGMVACANEWHDSQDERLTLRLNSIAAVTVSAITTTAVVSRRRPARLRAVRVDLALAALAGAFLGPVPFAVESPGFLVSGFVAIGLFVASALVARPRPVWIRLLASATGFAVLWAVVLGWTMFFYEAP